MNKDQVKGVAKEISGKVQQGVGKMTGNKAQQGEGLIKEAEGKAEKSYGDAKEVLKDKINKH